MVTGGGRTVLFNMKYILPTILSFIVIGIGSQFMLSGVPMSRILTFTCFDAFGLGSLLAWIITYKSDKKALYYKRFSITAGITLIYFIYAVITKQWQLLSIRTTVSLLTVWFIFYIYRNY